MKKTKRIGVIFTPLNISPALICRGGSLSQVHNAESGEFVPDRELTPLILSPEVYMEDPDGILANGKIQLSGVMWYALPQDVAEQVTDESYFTGELSQYLITAAAEGFSVAADGTLTVSRNVDYLDPVVLVFTGNYADIRSGNIIRIQALATLSTTSIAVAASLVLDKPSSFRFNPMSDTGLRTINASLLFGGQQPDPQVCSVRYWWYKIVGGVESLIDPEDDLFYEAGQNTASLVIDPRYVDGSLRIVCKAEYATDGESLPASPTADCLKAETTVIRRYPDYDFDNYVHGGVEVPSGATVVKNECVVTVGRTVLDSASAWFSVKWSIKRAVNGADWITLGYGDSIFIDADEFANGADVGLEIEEIQPLKAIEVDNKVLSIDGKVITL